MKTSSLVRAPVPRDILSALSDLGLDYTVSGNNARILCPWHDDHTPSCYVHVDSGLVYCQSCQAAGQFARLVQAVLGSSWERAALWCQLIPGGSLRSSLGRPEGTPRRVDTTRVLNEASLALFVPPPERELRKRGISPRAAAELGVLWDAEKRAWVLPMRDRDGKLHGWQYKKGHDVWNHPRGLRKAEFLFGLSSIGESTAVLVESPLDVAVLRTAGHLGGLASYGVRVSGVQLGLITAACDKLVFAGDNDDAGYAVAEALRTEFHRLPLWFYDYSQTRCKDIGEMWMNDEDILWGIKRATSAMVTRF